MSFVRDPQYTVYDNTLVEQDPDKRRLSQICNREECSVTSKKPEGICRYTINHNMGIKITCDLYSNEGTQL